MKFRWILENTSYKIVDKIWTKFNWIQVNFRQNLDNLEENLGQNLNKFRQNLELDQDWHTLKQFRQILEEEKLGIFRRIQNTSQFRQI